MEQKKIYDIVDEIPDYKEFMTVAELDESSKKLAAEFENVEILNIGKSKEGRVINCLKIGNGKKNALLFACPHPNEPIGSMTIEFSSRYLAEHKTLLEQLDYTFYMVKAIDIDGTVLNEGWFKGPFNPKKYAYNYYRPYSPEQIEWSFPIKYKNIDFNSPVPATQALMNIIDKVKPDFMFSLHNAGFGGVYYYLTGPRGNLFTELLELVEREKLPLHLGEPEAPFIEKLHPGIFQMFGIGAGYDFMEQNGLDEEKIASLINSGTSSYDYLNQATNGKGYTLVCEMPYFFDPRISDTTEIDEQRRTLKLALHNHMEEVIKWGSKAFEYIKPYCNQSSRIFTSIEGNLLHMEKDMPVQKKIIQENPMYDCKATVAGKFDTEIGNRYYMCLMGGQILRLFDEASSLHPNKKDEIQQNKVEFKAFVENMLDDVMSKTDFEVIPIQKLVKIQVGSMLLTLKNLE
jgi:hypothetical protein